MSQPGPESTPAQDAASAAQDVLSAADVARALLATEALTEQLGKTAREARELRATVRRGKQVIIALVISFALDLAITAGLGWNTIRQNSIQDARHAELISACRQTNANRLQDAAIWNTLLNDLAPPKVRTPQVRAELATINRRIAAKDTPRNCELLYKTR